MIVPISECVEGRLYWFELEDRRRFPGVFVRLNGNPVALNSRASVFLDEKPVLCAWSQSEFASLRTLAYMYEALGNYVKAGDLYVRRAQIMTPEQASRAIRLKELFKR
jgi:hypothetical protein